MTIYAPGNTLTGYLAPNLDLPNPKEEPDLFYEVMNERERNTASVINIKENGIYQTIEQLTSQTWFAAAADPLTKTRDTFRKVINFGALPNAGTKSVAHGISVTARTSFTKIYAVATNPNATGATPFAFPISGFDPSDITKPVMVWVDVTNVNIESTSDLTAYTTCYVVLEYLQN